MILLTYAVWKFHIVSNVLLISIHFCSVDGTFKYVQWRAFHIASHVCLKIVHTVDRPSPKMKIKGEAYLILYDVHVEQLHLMYNILVSFQSLSIWVLLVSQQDTLLVSMMTCTFDVTDMDQP